MLTTVALRSLTKPLLWLVWLIGLTTLLLAGSFFSFRYMQQEADQEQTAAREAIALDTLPMAAARRAVTVAKLIAAPEKYHGQHVRVKGYLHLEFEGDALYWRQADYRNDNLQYACWVSFTDSLANVKQVAGYSGQYVVIDGTFKAGWGGHGGLFAGSISDITSLNVLSTNGR